MKRKVQHKALMLPGITIGSIFTTTLCRRMDNSLKDGWNVDKNVSCKCCLRILNDSTHWAHKQMKYYAKVEVKGG